jgi:alpha-tubulin suppressor-like RCC1 family protein
VFTLKKKKCISLFVIAFTLGSTLTFGSHIYADSTESDPHPSNWIAMSSGGSHRLAIKQDGTVWAWGSNREGQLGIGTFGEPQTLPVQVKNLKNVVQIGTGNFNSYAVLKDGTVWSWGDNTDGQVGDGTVTERKIGSGEAIENNNRNEPVQLKQLSHIVAITGNFAASFALQDDGTLWGWGFVSIPYQSEPVKLIDWTDIKGIATGYSGNLLAVKKNGTVWINGKDGPVQIKGLDHITAVAVSAGSCFALREDGTVWAWGENSGGELGDGTTTSQAKPIKNPYIHDVVEIQATQHGPVYLKKDGTVWANGRNNAGNLGIGSYEDSKVPVQVRGLTHIRHISASSTGGNVMALREDNTLWAWGDGYVGDGTKWWRTEPVLVKSNDAQPDEKADTIKVDLNGKAVHFEQFPVLINETTMVPMRKLFELLGAKIDWDGETSTVTATKQGSEIQIMINQSTAIKNGQTIKLDSPAIIIDGSTFVPVRFVAESFGATVHWDEVTSTVKIDTK